MPSKESEPVYPIAEIFESIQGEGVFAGTPMLFVRFAGCNVGRYINSHAHATCKTALGASFACDTDYRVVDRLTLEELVDRINASKMFDVCLTGGEPFLHDLAALITACSAEKNFHIETSGTLAIGSLNDCAWITCSPKDGFLPDNASLVDEWKFLVQDVEELKAIEEFFSQLDTDGNDIVYLQAVNKGDVVDLSQNMMLVEIVKNNPRYRLSTQLHKFLGLR